MRSNNYVNLLSFDFCLTFSFDVHYAWKVIVRTIENVHAVKS